MEGLDLPEWNVRLGEESFDCSPPKQPLAQATLKDGNTQRVSALGPWKAAAAPAAAAPAPKPVYPAAAAAATAGPPVAPARAASDAENNGLLGGAAPVPEPPRSVRRTHTPSRTGLTARAVRAPPSRLGMTPGAGKAAEQFEVPASARALATGAAPPTGKNLKSILKRLNFSATKARAAAATAAGAGGEAPATTARAAAATLAQPAAESTIKQLRFDAGATPAADTAAKPAGRHVSFGAGTVSPAARGARPARAPAPGSAGPAARTPEPTIEEEDSEGSAGASTVNSAAAGHTPYDRRLSSLFRKYQVAGTPELPDAELDDLVADGAVRSPSWKRLSSTSVPESIRELAKKYNSDGGSLRGLTPPEGASPLPASPAPAAAAAAAAHGAAPMEAEAEAEAEAATPAPAGGRAEADGSSPAMDPTPHAVLDSIMKRNALYESSPAEAPAAAGQPQPQAAAQPAAATPAPAGGAAVPPSPGTAVAQLFAPVLLATIQEIGADKQAAAQAQQQQGSPAAAAGSPAFSSPADFYGFPRASQEAATPGAAQPPRSASVDGVPRGADGVPTVTPATVTVRRGSFGGGLGIVLEEDGDLALAANLFGDDDGWEEGGSFSPLGDGVHAFSPPAASPGGAFGSPAVCGEGAEGEEQEQAIEVGDAEPQEQQEEQQEEQEAAEASAATPAGAGADFSFFPATAAAGYQAAQAEGATPELTGLPAGHQVSPEILGFYEQQEAAAQRQATAAATPALPKSIIKSGRPLNEAGTPVLGHAQRAPPGEAPPTATREIRALLADLRLGDATELEEMGTVSTLSPVRATGALRGFLGGLKAAITPVRRSARKKAAPKPLEAMLEETGFSYVPNAALMAEDAAPKQEAAEARAARKAASRASSQAGAEPCLEDQPEVSNVPAPASARRYSTRSAAKAPAAEPAPAEDQEAALTAAGAAAATPQAAPAAGRRMSLRRLRTPMQMAHMAGGEVDENAGTPAATLGGASNAPVAQDASPQLAESPSCVAAAAAAASSTPYSLRASTLKARQSMGTPLPAATPVGSGKKGPQLSPTEQGIRASLRRSARKSKGGGAGSQ